MNTNDIILLVIAAFNLLTAFLSWRTHVSSKATQADVKKVELATNSMKDALVLATGKAAHAAGLAEGKLSREEK